MTADGGRPPERPTICLNMIVRNEAHVIRETLGPVVPHVDYWVIVDTGSTDRTRELLQSYFRELGIPGELHERPWRNFGANRTEALELARGKADFLWVIDADDLLVGIPDLTRLEADSYLVRYGPDLAYWRRQLFRSGLPWRYVGVLHEYPTCDSSCTEARLEGDYYVETRHLGDRSRAPDKYERDCRLLLAALEDDPADERTVFYLAQSYFSAGKVEEALRYYSLRAAMGGWGEEVFHALLRKAACMELLGDPLETVVDAYLASWRSRPSRAEPLYEITRLYRTRDAFDRGYIFAQQALEIPYPEDDLLFVAADVYRWRIRDELSICAYYLGREQESFELCRELLDEDVVPEGERDRVLANRDFASAPALEEAAAYPAEMVDRLTAARRTRRPRITFTVTTCKRLDLFEKTMNSFLNSCVDAERIGRWVCVDDGSSESDRRRMRELYPFFEFVLKTPGEKGHARSMNLILDLLDSPYWLHMEDDRQFFVPDRYVEKALSILRDDPTLGQVLFSRNYAETLEDRRIVGGVVRWTSREGHRYRVHEHVPPGTDAYERFFARHPPGSVSNAWWPHYSLHPSLVRTSAIKRVGRYSLDDPHFELEFANRYADKGYLAAFLDSVNSLHTGTLSWERGSERRPNAYDLNDLPQPWKAPIERPARVKLLADWTSSAELCRLWSRQSQGDGRWGDIEVTSDEDVDFCAIVNRPGNEDVSFRPDRTIVFQMEPAEAVDSWGSWARPDPRRFLQVRTHDLYANPAEWHLALTYQELLERPIHKTADLSAVVSGRDALAGQRLRVGFLKDLEDSGTHIDIFGKENVQGFSSYRGSLPPLNKNDGILPYRYTLAVENSAEQNYFTEKIVDAILGECLAFYWGCPNLEDYFDPESFVRLPLEDFQESRRIVEAAIRNDEWGRRIGAIRRVKQRILDEHQFFPTVARIVRGHRLAEALPVRVINLDRRPERWRGFVQSTRSAAGEHFLARCRRFAAVDGESLRMTEEIRHLFRGNEFGFRRGTAGCALSHLELWREAAGGEGPGLLIFEDDVQLRPGFWGRLVEACGRLVDAEADFDVALLGFGLWDGGREPELHADRAPTSIRPIRWENYYGGCYGYVVSRAGAQKLVALAERDGIQTAIDYFFVRKADEVRIVQPVPHLVSSRTAFAGTDVPSDIQYDFESLLGDRPDPPEMPDVPAPRRRRSAGPAPLSLLAPSTQLGEIRLDVSPAWPAKGATIAADGDGFRLIVATGSGERPAQTLNYLVRLGSRFEVVDVEPLRDREGSGSYAECRLLRVADEWLATAMLHRGRARPRQSVLTIEAGEILHVQPLRTKGELVPFEHHGSLLFVQGFAPTAIARYDLVGGGFEPIAERKGPLEARRFCGASQGLPLADGTLFVVRDDPAHRFVQLDDRFSVTGLSQKFQLLGGVDERCGGLARRNGDLVLSFGVGDRAGLAVVEEDEALALLGPPRK